MPKTASRAEAKAKILENAQTVMLSVIGVHQSKSQQATKPDDDFGIDLVNYL